jgi:hypothetical protein
MTGCEDFKAVNDGMLDELGQQWCQMHGEQQQAQFLTLMGPISSW